MERVLAQLSSISANIRLILAESSENDREFALPVLRRTGTHILREKFPQIGNLNAFETVKP